MDIEEDGFVTVVGATASQWDEMPYTMDELMDELVGDLGAECDRMADLIAKVQNGGQLICPGKHDETREQWDQRFCDEHKRWFFDTIDRDVGTPFGKHEGEG